MGIEELKKKAEKGDPAAQEKLGAAYEMGDGVEKDFEKSVYWTTKSAEQGYAKGQFYLGMAYFQGEGENCPTKAAYWFFKSALQDYKENSCSGSACFGMALEEANIAELVAMAKNDDVKTRGELGFNIIKQDRKKGLDLIMKAADEGYAKAQSLLGVYYQDGMHGLSKDDKKAFSLYEKAAAQKYVNAIINLGACYDSGVGVEKDYDKAIELYEKAERLGGNAKRELENVKDLMQAELYVEGHQYFEAKDYKSAITKLTKALDMGNSSAALPLGMIYLEGGHGVKSDFEKAVSYFEEALGEKEAYEHIGIVHLEGDGVEVNLEIAVQYLQKAFDLGKKDIKKPLKMAKKRLKKAKKGK
jgi:hypothetical protein